MLKQLKRNLSNKSSGFTLIELLVAISIVAVIFGIIITSASAIQRSTRDTQRKNDLKNLQSALQRYYADQGFYPSSAFDLNSSTSTSFTDLSGNPNISTATKTYIKTIPKDSLKTKPYCYIGLSNKSSTDSTECNNQDESLGNKRCHFYKIYADLENGSVGTATCGTGTTVYNYEVSPIQF
jgi:prepilin-type N-terminal cleavage/methylation domain-containing protein